RLVSTWTRLSEARYRKVYDPRILASYALGVEPVAGQVSDLEVLDHHIRSSRQAPHDIGPTGILEVDGEALLAAVDRQVVTALTTNERRSPGPRIVAPRRLDLYDPGT